MKKRLKVVSIVAASVMGLLAVLLCFASPVTKNYVNRHGKTLTGRKVQVDKVKVNALSGRIMLFGLEVMEEDDTVLFLEIDTVDVKIALLKLLSHNLEMRHAFVTGLKVNILQDGNHFNFSSIIDHFASQKDPLASHSTSKKWRLGFDDIRLRHWKVSYKDLQRKSQWDLSDVNLLIPGIYFNSDRNTGAGLELEMAGGGSLTTKLDYNMQSNHFNLTLRVNDFAISSAKVYLDDAMQLERLDGTLAGELKAIGNLSELLKTKVTGSLDLKNFAMSNTNGQEMWGAKSVLVKIKEMNLDALNVDIEKVVIDGARSHFCRYKEGNSYNAFFVADKKQSDDNRQATVEARKKEK
ncbi:MAG: DUF748 domain-containing protein, partial [Bacteroidales bacterium]|nr:DUF748 domain-containing protein [Bacteroidales bacterium]